MSRQKRGNVVTRRQEAYQAALAAEIDPAHYDQLLAIEQLATLLSQETALEGSLAFKGGAIMRLISASVRVSPDLDVSLRPQLRGGSRITKRVLEKILDPKKCPFLASSPVIIEKRNGLVVPALYCRHRASLPPVIVSLSFNWRDPILLEPEWGSFKNTVTGNTVWLPLVDRKERFSEKFRAFLERRDDPCRDVFDLYFYWTTILSQIKEFDYKPLISTKLNSSDLPKGTDLSHLARAQIERAGELWPGKTIFQGTSPAWEEVEGVVLKIVSTLDLGTFSKETKAARTLI